MNQWVCDVCAKKFSTEIDLLAHLFNSSCERELAKREAAEQTDAPDGAKRRLTGRNGKPTNVLADDTLDPAPPVI